MPRVLAVTAAVLVATALLLPVEHAGAMGDGGAVFLLGDSVMAGAEDALRARLPGRALTISTWVGRQLRQGVDELQQRRGEIDRAVVIHLGNNWYGTPASLDAELDRAMTTLRGVERVVWVNTHNRTDWMATVNAGIARASQRWPRLVVVDWAAVVRRDPRLVYGDATHLTPAGRAVYAGLIAEAVALPVTHEFHRCRPTALPPATPDPAAGSGYWMLADDGTVFAFGGVAHLGDIRGRPATRLVGTRTGAGYWIVADDGSVHAFGDAASEPRPASVTVAASGLPFPGAVLPADHAPIVGAVDAPSGGFWLAAADGGVFSVDAPFRGSAAPMAPSAPIEDVEAGPDGYWLLGADGGVFAFGDDYHGSIPALGFCGDAGAVALRATRTGGGYWITTDAGHVFTFGDAPYLGGAPTLAPGQRIVDADAT